VKHHPIASPKLRDGKVKYLQSGIMPIKVSEKLVYKNALIVGDAGGLVNPLHKGGIFPARKSAEIASKYAKAFLESGREEQLHGYESEIRHEFYEQNYRYDRLIQNIFADDEIVDKLIQRANEKQNLSESFEELLMFFSHKKVYDSMKRDVAETISEIYPMSPAEATRNLIMIPRNLTFDELVFDVGKTLVAVSYCVKSFGCPKERFSLECDETCDLCSMSQLRRTSANMGFDFRIATDDDRFIEFLEDNYEKYKSLIAIVCPYTTNKIGYSVHKIFGLKGVVIPLKGDVCTSEDKYMKGMKGEKANQTKTDLQTFFGIMERIKEKETAHDLQKL
jgi:hypothetical protein